MSIETNGMYIFVLKYNRLHQKNNYAWIQMFFIGFFLFLLIPPQLSLPWSLYILKTAAR